MSLKDEIVWFEANQNDLKEAYPDCYIAVKNRQIVSGKSYGSVYDRAIMFGFKNEFLIRHVDYEDSLTIIPSVFTSIEVSKNEWKVFSARERNELE